MTTFQAIVYSIIHAVTELLPISSAAHHDLVPFFIGWEHPSGFFLGTLHFSTFLALLIYFRHDWASMISSFLQLVIFRKKPMTIDEWMPFFITIAIIPSALIWFYFREPLQSLQLNPLIQGVVLFAFGFPLWLFDSLSRKNKSMSDWNGLDALIVGTLQIAALVPGCGIQTMLISTALMRNYNREAATKFAFFVITPILGAASYYYLKGFTFKVASPMPNLSWLSLGTSFLVSFLASLLLIGGFMGSVSKPIERKGFGNYFIYRTLLFIAIAGFILYKNR